MPRDRGLGEHGVGREWVALGAWSIECMALSVETVVMMTMMMTMILVMLVKTVF